MSTADTQIRGSMTALVTPFRNGEVDWPCLEKLVDRQIDGGTDWLVPLGTTGESPTLSKPERDKLLDLVLTRANGRCPVMVGTGSNNTANTIARTKQAAAAGANAALVVAPSYNRPTQEGLFRHYAAVADAAELPLVLYNVPARTGVNITNDTVVRLRRQYPNILALKDATGGVDLTTDLLARCDITVLSGDDSLTWPFIALGAVGAISVVANLSPALMKRLVDAGLHGDLSKARDLHRKAYAIAAGLARFGPNPLPIKTAMAAAGLIAEEFRLPLCPLANEARQEVEALLRRLELLEQPTV
ncbi:MAG: 4-hydroxy-tetrahydrodipicolinate synthase [Phycisphaerae bacterium]